MIGTPWDDSGGGGVLSVNGLTGEVTLTPGDIGADTQGAGIAAVADHMGEGDPHPQYQLRSEAGVASGYAQLNPDALVLQDPASASAEPGPNLIAKTDSAGTLDAWISAASTTNPGLAQFAADAEVASNKAVAANDTRLSNARTPTAHATSHQHGGSDEIGTATAAPNAIPKADSAGKLDGWISSATTSTPGLVQLASDAESSATKAVTASDSRLSNSRTPSSHATSHKHGGSDEIAVATAAANAIPKATTAGKLDSGWGGGVNSLATLDSSTLVPTAQHGTGTADSTTFLRGDRVWSPAVVGNLGSTDNALVRVDGSGGLTAQGSPATLDDAGNLKTGSRSLNQPIAPSPWSGATSNHDLPIPTWATTAGKYYALARMRIQQNATTSAFQGRTHQFDLTFNGSVWTIDATASYGSLGSLGATMGWSISGGTNLRLALSAMGASNSGNVGLVFEQFVFLGAL